MTCRMCTVRAAAGAATQTAAVTPVARGLTPPGGYGYIPTMSTTAKRPTKAKTSRFRAHFLKAGDVIATGPLKGSKITEVYTRSDPDAYLPLVIVTDNGRVDSPLNDFFTIQGHHVRGLA